MHNLEFDNILNKVNVSYEWTFDCQFMNNKITKRMKYINDKKKDNIQDLTNDIDIVY